MKRVNISFEQDFYVTGTVYRVVTWNDHPRQQKEFAIIFSSYDEGDWNEDSQHDNPDAVITRLKECGVSL